MKKAIFLDRDGVINENVRDGPIDSFEKFHFLNKQKIAQAINMLHAAGYLVVIVTNQPNIAKGFYTQDALEKMHAQMKKELQAWGASIDAIYVCPHHPKRGFTGEILELKIDCLCRKPKPGLLLKAAKEYDIDLKNSWMIGDSLSDIAAGLAAETKTILVAGSGSGAEHEKNLQDVKPDATAKDLLDAVELIVLKKKEKEH